MISRDQALAALQPVLCSFVECCISTSIVWKCKQSG